MSTRYDPSVAAADPRRSAWVAANAGSGKTYTLANRVTRLLLDGSRPEKILCLTYTKAAASEMQKRLFDVLGELAMLPDDLLGRRLNQISGEEALTGDFAKARRMFASALETPGGLKIQTIHSFCQSVLARFPLEAGIPPNFGVLDEQTSGALMDEAREQVLERAGSGDALLSAALARLLTQVSEARMNDILHTALGTDRRKLERFLGSVGLSPDALQRAIRDAHGVGESESEESILASFCSEARKEVAQLRAVVKWLERGLKSDKQKAERLAKAIAHQLPEAAFPAFLHALLTKEREKYQSLVTTGLARSNPDLLLYLEEFVDRLCEVETRRRAAYAAELCHATLIVAGAVFDAYATAKRRRGMLDYDDLSVETRKLLERSDAAQWVLFKLDGGLDHILIDEAQDTSPEQWAIVSKLSEEFFTGSGTRGDDVLRTIFAVGDEKQSIFSFQGADPKQFELFRNYFEQRAVAAECAFVSTPLLTSRRSAPEILAFVDKVFADADAAEGLTTSAQPIEHIAHRADARGRVEFWPALAEPRAPDPDPLREMDLPSRASAI